MRLKTILPVRMTQPRLVHAVRTLLFLAAACAAHPSSAQYGTPENLRRMTPTVQDRDPGQAGDESEMDPAYRRQPVFYRTAVAERSPA